MRLVTVALITISIAACGLKDSQACTTSTGVPQPVSDTMNSFSCPIGQVLVGYRPDGVAGPLLCASLTTSCPLPPKGERAR